MAAPLLCLADESLVAVERGLRQHQAYVMQPHCGCNSSITRQCGERSKTVARGSAGTLKP